MGPMSRLDELTGEGNLTIKKENKKGILNLIQKSVLRFVNPPLMMPTESQKNKKKLETSLLYTISLLYVRLLNQIWISLLVEGNGTAK